MHPHVHTALAASLAVAVALTAATEAPAQVRLPGYFIAEAACEAFQSKNNMTNPGTIMTEPDRAYEMIGINKTGGDFFQVRVPGAPVTIDRWVHVSCGVHVVEADTETAEIPRDPPTPEPGAESEHHLLALSWQPAFCETRPNKTECELLNAGGLPITETQLSLHGLWPQPRGKFFCGVEPAVIALDEARQWESLPTPQMDDDTRERLVAAMPGTMSGLDRHEWIKHGTCHKDEDGADGYFDDTLLVMEAINGSAVGAFLAAHLNAEIETRDLRDAFDATFGPGAGDRVQVQCTGDGGRVLVQELRINMRGVIDDGASVSDLILAGDTVSPGCPRGVIDPAGLQ